MALSQSTPSTSHSQLPTISPDHLISLKQQPSSTIKESTVYTSNSPAVFDNGSSPAGSPNRLSNNYKHRQSTLSTSSSKQNRTGLFTLAALARDKTTNAIASLSEPSIRPRPSSSSLYRSAQSSPTSATHNSSASHNSSNFSRSGDSQASPRENTDLPRNSTTSSPTSLHTRTDTISSGTIQRQSLLETNPPSQAYSNTAADTPPPIAFVPHGNYNKMHQTSSRLLRMTSDDRPFTRVGKSRRYRCGHFANIRAGFQRSLCNTGRQPSACTTPRTTDKGGPFIFIRRGHQQLGILEILPI